MQVVDETQADLRAMIQRDLGVAASSLLSSADFHHALLDWLHFRARSIPQRPRTVILSPQVHAKLRQYPAILNIRNALARGKDVSAWLSDSVRRKEKVTDPKTDMMFNDWQIIHFHLGDLFVAKNKIRRTRDVLFAFIASDRAVLLDVTTWAWGKATMGDAGSVTDSTQGQPTRHGATRV